MWSTNLKRCPFYFLLSDFTSEKSWPCTLTFCGLPLNQWSPEKYIGRHTITFANLETVLSDFFKLKSFLIENHPFFGEFIPIQFYWRKIWPLFRSQFCPGIFSNFYVTLSHQPIWQTVQNHTSGHNLFICGRIWNLGIPNCSVWHWGKLKCIWRVWMSEIRLYSLKNSTW